jgi:hypothetical protein
MNPRLGPGTTTATVTIRVGIPMSMEPSRGNGGPAVAVAGLEDFSVASQAAISPGAASKNRSSFWRRRPMDATLLLIQPGPGGGDAGMGVILEMATDAAGNLNRSSRSESSFR